MSCEAETWAIAVISVSGAAQQVDEADGWRSSVGSPRRSAAAYLSRCAAYISGGDSSLKVLCWWQEVRHRWVKIRRFPANKLPAVFDSAQPACTLSEVEG